MSTSSYRRFFRPVFFGTLCGVFAWVNYVSHVKADHSDQKPPEGLYRIEIGFARAMSAALAEFEKDGYSFDDYDRVSAYTFRDGFYEISFFYNKIPGRVITTDIDKTVFIWVDQESFKVVKKHYGLYGGFDVE